MPAMQVITRKDKIRPRTAIKSDFPEFDSGNVEITAKQPEKATVQLLQNLCIQTEEVIDLLEQIRDKK